MGQGFKLATVAVVGILATFAVPARAQLLPGSFYIGAQGGWTHLETVTNDGHPQRIGPFAGQNAQSLESFDDGFNVGGRAGFKMGAWRLEGELSYRANDSHHLQMVAPSNRTASAISGPQKLLQMAKCRSHPLVAVTLKN